MSVSYIQAQIQSPNAQGTTINKGTAIAFDTAISKTDDIVFNVNNGLIVLNTPGVYYAEWYISLGGGDQTVPIVLSIDTTETNPISGSTMKTPGEVSGSAIFEITEMAQLTLINEAAQITLGIGSVMANIVIYSLEGSSGGNSGGSENGVSGSRFLIPFSSGEGITTYPGLDSKGVLKQVAIMSSGGLNNELPLYYPVTMGKYFTIPNGTDAAQYLFSVPYDVKIVAASAIFNNNGAINYSDMTTHISPYIAIATQYTPGTYNFEIQEESRVYPAKGYIGNNPNTTVLTAKRTDLDIIIPAETPFAITAGLINLGTTPIDCSYFIYMHGSIILEAV